MKLILKNTVITERELVLNTLDRLYTLNSDDSSITIADLNDGSTTSFSSLVKEMNRLFGIYTHYTCEEWYKNTYAKICVVVHTYLRQLSFQLGRTNWELYHNDNRLFEIEHLFEEFKDHYSEDLLLYIYEKWYEDAVIQHCENFYLDF